MRYAHNGLSRTSYFAHFVGSMRLHLAVACLSLLCVPLLGVPCPAQQAPTAEQAATAIRDTFDRMAKAAKVLDGSSADGSLSDEDRDKLLSKMREDDQLVLSIIRTAAQEPHFVLESSLRLALTRARGQYADPVALLETVASSLEALKGRSPVGRDAELRVLAAEAFLDAGLPWRAGVFVQQLPIAGRPDAKKVADAISRVTKIFEDDSPRVACTGRDEEGRAVCEKLRHLLAVPPIGAGLYSEFADFLVSSRVTYPAAGRAKTLNARSHFDDPSLAPKVNEAPLLGFVAGVPQRAEGKRVIRAAPLSQGPLGGTLKNAVDQLSSADSPNARRTLVEALKADKGALGSDTVLGDDPTMEVIEVRRAPSYTLIFVKAVAEFSQAVHGLIRLDAQPSRLFSFGGEASLVRHVGKQIGSAIDDAILLETISGTARFLELSVVNPRTATVLSFSEGRRRPEEEDPGYYHGTAHFADIDQDGTSEVILTRAVGEGRFDGCNQCPRRHATSIWKLASDLSAASRVGEFITWADVSFATGGLAGIGPEHMVASMEFQLFAAIRELASPDLRGPQLDELIKGVIGSIGAYEDADDRRSAINSYLEAARVLGSRPDASAVAHWRDVMRLQAVLLYIRDDRITEARALLNTVAAEVDRADQDLSRRLEEQRFDLARATGRPNDQFRSLSALESMGELSMPNVYRKLLYLLEIGDVDGADAVARAAAERADFWGQPGSYEVSFQRAVALFRKGEHDRALDILLVLTRYAAGSPTSKAFARLHLLGTQIAMARNEHGVARHLLDTAVAHMPNDLWMTDGPLVLSTFASILAKKVEIKQAEKVLAAAVRGGEPFKGLRLAIPQDLLAQLAEGAQRKAEAIRASNLSLTALTAMQTDIAAEMHKLSFVKSTDQLAAEQIIRLQRLGASPAAVFEAVESWRAQVLRSGIRDRAASELPHVEPGQLLTKLRAALGTNTALVSYFLSGPTPVAIILTTTDLRLVRLPTTRNSLRAMRRRLDAHMTPATAKAREAIAKDEIPAEMRVDLEGLHKALIAPLSLPPNVKSLVIVPDGEELYGLAWNALSGSSTPGTPQRPSHIAFQYVVRVLPSAHLRVQTVALLGSTLGVSRSSLRRFMPMYQAPLRAAGPIGFLSALPGVREEIETIATSLRGAGFKVAPPLIVGAEADADHLPPFIQSQFKGAGIVHIAGHGLFDSTNTMASALLLGDANERGVIQAGDLLKLDLHGTELVALSACQTGEVIVEAGQEAFGFVRALLMAGARRAIVSQWKVEDVATKTWFSLLYDRIATDGDIEQAYRHATLEAATRKKHPYYWAGFTLYSRGETAVVRATPPLSAQPRR
jgi:CHAT domain-containing protein